MNFELDLRNFVVDKPRDDGTLVPKHVEVDTWYADYLLASSQQNLF